LRTLLDDATRAREMGVNGRRWAAGHLTWGTVGAQMISAYQEILRGNARSPVE
jgi:hypothetical protein